MRSLIAVQIYNALIQPHFDYCAHVWDGLNCYLCEKLQKVNSSLLLETLKWDQLSLRRRKHKAIMMFKSLNGLAPVCCMNYSVATHSDSCVTLSRTNYLKRSFSYRGALLWNYLPESIRAIRSIGQFKMEINCALETFDSHSAIL